MTGIVTAAWALLTAPFPLFCLILAAAVIVAVALIDTRPKHQHYYRRLVSGNMACACGSTVDRYGRPIVLVRYAELSSADPGTITYWLDGEPITAAEYRHLNGPVQ